MAIGVQHLRRSKAAISFWLVSFATFSYGLNVYMWLIVGAHYHPMATKGDLFLPLRYGALILPCALAIIFLCLWSWRGPLSPRLYLSGIVILGLAALLPSLPRVDSGYRQVYWLGETRYEIPWQYSPYNGSKERGGKYFLVKVSAPELAPRYETREKTIIIGKAVDSNSYKGGPSSEDPCRGSSHSMECKWQVGDRVYSASGDAGLFPSDIPAFMASVADLLDGFEVSAR
ncbi:hypothetical protein [Pseudophaeobacter sp.]|uniref:hypothetical protein n=1 Tax=Pseudophaeobacter sp. TaxID=1971739 RepID=UPI004058DC1C